MSHLSSRLRRVLPAVLLVLAVAAGTAACGEIVPDNTPHSPIFHN